MKNENKSKNINSKKLNNEIFNEPKKELDSINYKNIENNKKFDINENNKNNIITENDIRYKKEKQVNLIGKSKDMGKRNADNINNKSKAEKEKSQNSEEKARHPKNIPHKNEKNKISLEEKFISILETVKENNVNNSVILKQNAEVLEEVKNSNVNNNEILKQNAEVLEDVKKSNANNTEILKQNADILKQNAENLNQSKKLIEYLLLKKN